ncbi:Mitochondrial inner membrane protease ATP23-like [Hondaea fermentalgiana]|uniref:Mitochondrial inner membrane protease ATP23 n=1 Tax=Hondaea fermentalgiana TaxID=2315210 RepID=A0A2R5FZP6_9STRA|nr:Mitochondrial inner membrane protease ATP23-like [Hondaea fermentalgiana]|eukprot:GBG24210.1 Mitochondrial inner membrane protease ATP23-like [Hondaea fermentalgiana]
MYAHSTCLRYFAAPNLKDLTSEEQPRIVMCANELRSRGEVREALRHELVHAFDHCVSRRDLAEPNGLACSEIRAAREAECRDNFHNILGELFCKAFVGADAFADKQDNMICKQLKESCARQVATTSVRAVFPAEGYTCIKTQFDKCYNDLAPFGQNDEHSSREGPKPTAP